MLATNTTRCSYHVVLTNVDIYIVDGDNEEYLGTVSECAAGSPLPEDTRPPLAIILEEDGTGKVNIMLSNLVQQRIEAQVFILAAESFYDRGVIFGA